MVFHLEGKGHCLFRELYIFWKRCSLKCFSLFLLGKEIANGRLSYHLLLRFLLSKPPYIKFISLDLLLKFLSSLLGAVVLTWSAGCLSARGAHCWGCCCSFSALACGPLRSDELFLDQTCFLFKAKLVIRVNKLVN